MNTKAELTQYGQSLIGKSAQSGLLTMISDKGQKVLEPSQKITAFEIVEVFQEPILMVTLGGESIFADTLINIQ